MTDKLFLSFTVGSERREKTIEDLHTLRLLTNMFDDQLVFNIDDVTERDNYYAELQMPQLDLIDGFQLSMYSDEAVRAHLSTVRASGTEVHDNHASHFFPYRLSADYSDLADLLLPLQVFTSLTDTHGKPRVELQYNCFIYALSQLPAFSDVSRLIRLSNRFNSNVHIPIAKLDAVAKEEHIKVIMRYVDDHADVIKSRNSRGYIGDPDGDEVQLVTFKEHYMLYREDIPVTAYYIANHHAINDCAQQHGKSTEWSRSVYRARDDGRSCPYQVKQSKCHITTVNLLKALFEVNAFTPLRYTDQDVEASNVVHYLKPKVIPDDLTFSSDHCCKLIQPPKLKYTVDSARLSSPAYRQSMIAHHHLKGDAELTKIASLKSTVDLRKVYYADFEASPGADAHVPFMCCVQSMDGRTKLTLSGSNCPRKLFTDPRIPNDAVIYYHNLGYDGRFLRRYGCTSSIDKGTKIMMQDCTHLGKTLHFRDSYSMLTQPLRRFPSLYPDAFRGLDIKKELFPYNYYSADRVTDVANAVGVISEAGAQEQPPWSEQQYAEFTANIDAIPGCRLTADTFDMMLYAEYYCQQDVNILRIGFNAFRESTLQEPIGLDILHYISAPALANAYMTRNVYATNEDTYCYSGIVQDFLMSAIYGGRCMTRENKAWHVTDTLNDFDACSLYPSAMRRLWTVRGMPALIPAELLDNKVYSRADPHYVVAHTLAEDELTPTADKPYSSYVVDIMITHIGTPRQFPLILKRVDGLNLNVNECCRMTVDNIMLEDLITYQDISYQVIKGYTWSGAKDDTIRATIGQLYEERVRQKREHNPIQETLKLIMNSSYGKTIQRPIKKQYTYVPNAKAETYKLTHYHQLYQVTTIPGGDHTLFEMYKPVSTQFNNCLYGVQVLSMSKRIMNEVMCLAEDLGLHMYYQDTDSIHIQDSEIPTLQAAFNQRYGRELIGSAMGQFHSDFDELAHDPVSVESYFIGKKMYVDRLTNDDQQVAYHVRLKGVPGSVIRRVIATEYGDQPLALYRHLYQGHEQVFDLCDGRPQFAFSKDGSIRSLGTFRRRVKRTAVGDGTV